MPSPTTVLAVCRTALALTNAVGTDQTLTDSEQTDCLSAFNDLMEDWSLQNLFMFGIGNYTFNTVANQATYTIGTGGFLNIRPVRIAPLAYARYNGFDFPVNEMTQAEYNAIAYKDIAQPYPTRYLYVNSFPYGLLTLYPVPSVVLPVTLTIDRQLTQVDSVNDTISFPQGYAKGFTYALAIELSSVFGKDVEKSPHIIKTAAETFANIKRANKKQIVMGFDPAYSGQHGGLANGRITYFGG